LQVDLTRHSAIADLGDCGRARRIELQVSDHRKVTGIGVPPAPATG
jgi:hypothetical protein